MSEQAQQPSVHDRPNGYGWYTGEATCRVCAATSTVVIPYIVADLEMECGVCGSMSSYIEELQDDGGGA